MYYLLYTDETGRRKQKSLGHADRRKAERQRAQFERELRTGWVEPESMKIGDFVDDSLERSGKQIRESTKDEYRSIMRDFVATIGNIDFGRVDYNHGEYYVQQCLDRGNTPDTVAKKVRTLKRFFNLAVKRRQLDEHPLRHLGLPKRGKKQVRTLSSDETHRLLKAARDWPDRTGLRWDLLIILALTTGMRKGELLNLVWSDVNFAEATVHIGAKKDTDTTWLWEVKDSDERILPLTDEVVNMLAEYQASLPEDNPYVFVPLRRYQETMAKKKMGSWSLTKTRFNLVGNFSRRFQELLRKANIANAKFHDLRRTALSDWLMNGMSVFDVMNLAGHANVATTQQFYLAISSDLLARARQTKTQVIDGNLLQICCSRVTEKPIEKADNCNQLPAKDLNYGQGRI